MKVVLVEEYATRERLSLLFLERALRRRGHEVLMSNIWRLQVDFRDFQPDVVVDNISDSVSHYAGKLAMLNETHRNVNLIWEQILCPWNVPRYRFSEIMARRFVDARVSWGPLFKRLLLAENPSIDPSRVWVTGAPNQAVALASRSVARTELRQALDHPFDQFDRTIVFAESFGAADLDLDRLRTGNSDQRSPYVFEWGLYAREMVYLFSRSISELARSHPAYLFILRLHPGKSLGYYDRYSSLTKLPNVRFDQAGSIVPLLRAADLMVAGKSGTLADAYFCGTPALQLVETKLPFGPTNILSVGIEGLSRSVNLDELTGTDFEEVMSERIDDEAVRGLAHDWFGDVGLEVFERLADVIEAARSSEGVPKRIPAHAYARSRVVKRRLGNLAKMHRVGVKSPPTDDYPYERLFRTIAEPDSSQDAETRDPQ